MKRKLVVDSSLPTAHLDTQSLPKIPKTSHKEGTTIVDAALPATPTSDRLMDSDEDLNSAVSSEDIGMDYDTDQSFDVGDGTSLPPSFTSLHPPMLTPAGYEYAVQHVRLVS